MFPVVVSDGNVVAEFRLYSPDVGKGRESQRSSYPMAPPSAAAAARHAGQVPGQAELRHLHFPGKLVDHDVPQSQVAVHDLQGQSEGFSVPELIKCMKPFFAVTILDLRCCIARAMW